MGKIEGFGDNKRSFQFLKPKADDHSIRATQLCCFYIQGSKHWKLRLQRRDFWPQEGTAAGCLAGATRGILIRPKAKWHKWRAVMPTYLWCPHVKFCLHVTLNPGNQKVVCLQNCILKEERKSAAREVAKLQEERPHPSYKTERRKEPCFGLEERASFTYQNTNQEILHTQALSAS